MLTAPGLNELEGLPTSKGAKIAGRARFLLTQAASVDCLLYLINRGLCRQGISGRSNRHAVSAVRNEGFER